MKGRIEVGNKPNTSTNTPNTIKTKVDYRGRIYLPAELRKKLQLKPNDKISIMIEKLTN
jgi:AbrB family looped-hinge helix DNA binding protein